MKKLKWLVLVMCCVLGLSVFVACGGGDNDGGTDTTVAVTNVSLPATRAMEVGQTVYLSAIITPDDATVDAATWKSSDTTKLTVADDGIRNGIAVGKLVGVAAGEVTVTVTAGDKSATCKVTVTEHIIPYYFLAGQSGAAYFNWNNYSREDDVTVDRVLKPVADSNEKVFSTTIDLFAGDSFKICKLTDAAKDNHWEAQLGGAEAASDATDEEKAELAEKLNISGATEKTELPCGTIGGGNPPAFPVTVEGKYEITLDLTGSSPVLSYKKLGATDPVAWSYTVGFHGSWGNVDNEEGTGKVWNTIDFGTATFDKEHLTATADIELQEAEGFGVKTVSNGEQVGWFNSDKITLAEGVTTITKNAGNNATCTAAGTYNVTITMNEDGSIANILFNSFTAASEAE